MADLEKDICSGCDKSSQPIPFINLQVNIVIVQVLITMGIKKRCIVCNNTRQIESKGMCRTCNARWIKQHNPIEYNRRRERRNMYDQKRLGRKKFSENKTCSMYLGIHVAEQVLSKVFKNVEIMPMNNPGYDFVCNHGKKIDVKSSCVHKNQNGWVFAINKNEIADYFLCIAFDNRKNLNPLHLWLLPSNHVNNMNKASISPKTIHKWDEYKLEISPVVSCCDHIRN